ncbi:MAG: hypothetical protein R3E34_07815 [Rhodocyclaceae bacterium]
MVAFTSETLGAQDIYVRLFDLNGSALTGSSRVNASAVTPRATRTTPAR